VSSSSFLQEMQLEKVDMNIIESEGKTGKIYFSGYDK
jgi:hypothetical protein